MVGVEVGEVLCIGIVFWCLVEVLLVVVVECWVVVGVVGIEEEVFYVYCDEFVWIV